MLTLISIIPTSVTLTILIEDLANFNNNELYVITYFDSYISVNPTCLSLI